MNDLKIRTVKKILGPYDAHRPNCGMYAGYPFGIFIIQYIDKEGKQRIIYSKESNLLLNELNGFTYLEQIHANFK